MNIIFDSQSIGFHVFWNLFLAARNEFPELRLNAGFFVTNQDAYEKFVKDTPEFHIECGIVLSEWEILDQAKRLESPDYEYIASWERRIGDATLWNPVICDRRFNYSIIAQYIQNYKPVYSHEFILRVLQIALQRIDEHFDQMMPDAIIGLNAVTLYDYLYYLIARHRGVPYFQLKLTRIENYVSLFTEPLDISPHIGKKIRKYLDHPNELKLNQVLLDEARSFVQQASKRALSYEGAISRDKNKPSGAKDGAAEASKKPFVSRISGMLFNKHIDSHYPSPQEALLFTRVVKPWRKKWVQMSVFKQTDISWESELKNHHYAVYPLNTEPEVALLVYGRAYRNQIETVRNIASSLPVGWKLVVKEHPNALGYRTRGYYQKLREIPNVILLGPATDTGQIVSNADLVFVVFGTIGLEAIIKRKPVITFCRTPYGSFPDTMVRFVEDMSNLSAEIRDLLRSYQFEEWALHCFVAAHIENSVRINLFTDLLGKSGRNRSADAVTLSDQYAKLARHMISRIDQEQKRLVNEKRC